MNALPHTDHETRWGRAHGATLIPDGDTPWTRMDPVRRSRLVTGCWAIVLALLFAGWFDARAFIGVVGVSLVHAVLFLGLLRFRPMVFPAQLRIAFLAIVTLGTFVPGLRFLLAIATVGGSALLTVGYCPLARMLYLLPWNRTHALSPRQAWQTITTAPSPGRFRLTPEQVSAALPRSR